MVTNSTIYKDKENLITFIKENKIKNNDKLLIQIYSGTTDLNTITGVINTISSILDKSQILGCSSHGEVCDGMIYDDTIVITFTQFEKSTVKVRAVSSKEDNLYFKAKHVSNEIITRETKLAFLYVSQTFFNGERIIEGLEYNNSELLICGGYAGSSRNLPTELYENTVNDDIIDAISRGTQNMHYVFDKDNVYVNGFVVGAISGEDFMVNLIPSFNWIPTGKEHSITSFEGHVIKTIDNIPAKKFYEELLGTKVDNIPYLSLFFPFMIDDNGVDKTLTIVIDKASDHILTPMQLYKGMKFRIGYGNKAHILNRNKEVLRSIENLPCESIFSFSCNLRRIILKEQASFEVEPLKGAISVNGYFGHGDFTNYSGRNKTTTHTNTFLVMSENPNKRINVNCKASNEASFLKSDEEEILFTLLEKSSSELKRFTDYLEEEVQLKTRELEDTYYHDSITHIYNLEKLNEDLRDRKYSHMVAIEIPRILIYKYYYGNEVFEELLKAVTGYINAYFRDLGTTIYQISLNVFTIAAGYKTDVNELVERAEKLYKTITSNVFKIQGNEITVDISVGTASDKADLLEKSTIALFMANFEKIKFARYEDKLDVIESSNENIRISHEVRAAIDEDRILPFFQPIYDNAQQKVTKYECLIRLRERDGNILSPGVFLEPAKMSGFYHELTEIMINKSFDKFENTDYEFSMNLILDDIINQSTRKLIFERLATFKCPENVIFEIVESEGIDNFEEVNEFISEIRKMGARIAIDDFGSGYSNFLYLARLNTNYIKVDGSIVKNIIEDPVCETIVKGVTAFAKANNKKVIAEYVCDEKIQDKILEIGVDYSQGFYIGKPLEDF